MPKKMIVPPNGYRGIKKVEFMHLSDICEYEYNAKKHSAAQIEKITQSINDYGFNNPILIDPEKKEIIAGHGRFRAASELGMSSVPVVRVEHLSESEIKAYRIADNKLSEFGSGWDEDLLSREVVSLEDTNIDLSGLGFSDKELDVLFDNIDSELPVDEETFESVGTVPKLKPMPVRIGRFGFYVEDQDEVLKIMQFSEFIKSNPEFRDKVQSIVLGEVQRIIGEVLSLEEDE